jgi:hypothetical protein
MASPSPRTRRRRSQRATVSKPRGTFHPRVQAATPERFGIVSVDCHKARFFSAEVRGVSPGG